MFFLIYNDCGDYPSVLFQFISAQACFSIGLIYERRFTVLGEAPFSLRMFLLVYSFLFFQYLLQQDGFVGCDEIDFVFYQPSHVLSIIYSPCIDFHAKFVTLFNPFRILLEDTEVIVRACTSPPTPAW